MPVEIAQGLLKDARRDALGVPAVAVRPEDDTTSLRWMRSIDTTGAYGPLDLAIRALGTPAVDAGPLEDADDTPEPSPFIMPLTQQKPTSVSMRLRRPLITR